MNKKNLRKNKSFYCICIVASLLVLSLVTTNVYALTTTQTDEKQTSSPIAINSNKDGLLWLENKFGSDKSLKYTGTSNTLGFYEYDSNTRFYAVDPVADEVMTVISTDLSPLFNNISSDCRVNAMTYISSIDEDFFKYGAYEEILVLENGETSLTFEELDKNKIGTGRIAGIRVDSKGNIISLAFSISSEMSKNNKLKATKATLSKEKALKIAITDMELLVKEFEKSMNEMNSTFFPDEKQSTIVTYADNGKKVNSLEDNTEFKVYLDSSNPNIICRESFLNGRQVWKIEIDGITTSMDTALKFWYCIDSATGEIVLSERSM